MKGRFGLSLVAATGMAFALGLLTRSQSGSAAAPDETPTASGVTALSDSSRKLPAVAKIRSLASPHARREAANKFIAGLAASDPRSAIAAIAHLELPEGTRERLLREVFQVWA